MLFVLYLFDGMTALDAIGPYDLLNRLPDVEVRTVGDGADEKVVMGGMRLIADADLAEVTAADVLLVPGGGWRGVTRQTQNERVLEWVQDLDGRTTWTASICTGALVLGAAGLLRGRRATTHWRSRDALDKYGATYVDERVVQDGTIMTGAGVTAGLDLALTLADRLAGRDVAEAVQLSAQYDPQPPFPPHHPDSAPERVLDVVVNQLGPVSPV
jgi:transcriptional regulator GlxA family with amidase domain